MEVKKIRKFHKPDIHLLRLKRQISRTRVLFNKIKDKLDEMEEKFESKLMDVTNRRLGLDSHWLYEQKSKCRLHEGTQSPTGYCVLDGTKTSDLCLFCDQKIYNRR